MQRLPLLLSVLALALVPLAPTLAHADEPIPANPATSPVPPAATAPAAQTWYGWQPLMVDGGSIATIVAGTFVHGAEVTPIEILGVGGFALGSPLIHLAHEHPGKAAGSFLLRALVPGGAFFTGLFVGALAGSGSQQNFGELNAALTGAIIGGLSGTVLAAGIDDIVIAREPARAAQPADARPAPIDLRPTFEPRVSSVRGGATLGIGGTF